MKVKPIREKISPQMIPNVLLIGNGISMAAKRSSSWEKLIKSALKNNNVEYKYSKIKSLPANMQIVVATKNHVNTELKSIVNPMFTKIDSDSSIFL